MLLYILVFIASFLVDVIPFFGPPAWTVMVFFQMRYSLNIWMVLVFGVIGSAVGRYTLSLYMPFFSDRFLNTQKKEDIDFLGKKLSGGSWKVQLFVLLYTMVPLPSVPLFTAAGIARVKTLYFMPAFIVGKFVSDMIMVLSGDYAAKNALAIAKGVLSWKSLLGTSIGITILVAFLSIDWRALLVENKFRLNFKIWK
jgi:membrane protein YqaA with SNARE-associated domain